MSTYETLSLMIAFGVLIVMIIGTKNSHLPPKANVTIFELKFFGSHSLERTAFFVPLL